MLHIHRLKSVPVSTRYLKNNNCGIDYAVGGITGWTAEAYNYCFFFLNQQHHLGRDLWYVPVLAKTVRLCAHS